MIYICIATPEEMKLLPRVLPEYVWDQSPRIVITGVGGSNVVRKLRGVAKNFDMREDFVWNVGYCGTRDIEPGTVVHIDKCHTYHPGVEFAEPNFTLFSGEVDDKHVTCLTAGDFVTDPASIPLDKWGMPCVVDMELAYLCALFPNQVSSIKVVSDNCDLAQYENNLKK